MQKTILNFLILPLFISCATNTRERTEAKLTNNDLKYWYRYHSDTLKPYSLGYCIFKNGTFIRYYNPNHNKKNRIINDSPAESKPIWKLINDSTIMFGKGNLYKIVFLNADSMVLSNLEFPSLDNYLRLHRDNDQNTKPQPLE